MAIRRASRTIQARLLKQLRKHRAALEEARDNYPQGENANLVPAWQEFEQAVNWPGIAKLLRKALLSVLLGLAAEAVSDVLGYYGELDQIAAADLERMTRENGQRYRDVFIPEIIDSSQRQLAAAFSRWLDSGKGLATLETEIKRLFPIKAQAGVQDRAMLIAISEVTRIYAAARQQRLVNQGVRWMYWQTQQDEKVCTNICRPLGEANGGRGARADVNTGLFTHPDTGQTYSFPAHPGCRCWPASEDELGPVGETA